MFSLKLHLIKFFCIHQQVSMRSDQVKYSFLEENSSALKGTDGGFVKKEEEGHIEELGKKKKLWV